MIEALLRVKLEPGMFDNEYTAILTIGDREVSSTVDKGDIRDIKTTDSGSQTGLLLVRVLEVNEETGNALVDLPRSAFTSEPRLNVPREALVAS
jgi:hypothetical protein